MKKNESIQQKAEETLNSLDGLRPAEAPAHLYTRIHARLQQPAESTWTWFAAALSRPSVALGISFLLLAINAWIIFSKGRQDIPERTDSIAALAQEYDFEHSSLLDQNTQQP